MTVHASTHTHDMHITLEKEVAVTEIWLDRAGTTSTLTGHTFKKYK